MKVETEVGAGKLPPFLSPFDIFVPLFEPPDVFYLSELKAWNIVTGAI
jgi:hypothetical protein